MIATKFSRVRYNTMTCARVNGWTVEETSADTARITRGATTVVASFLSNGRLLTATVDGTEVDAKGLTATLRG